jgi:hypothetical protein
MDKDRIMPASYHADRPKSTSIDDFAGMAPQAGTSVSFDGWK